MIRKVAHFHVCLIVFEGMFETLSVSSSIPLLVLSGTNCPVDKSKDSSNASAGDNNRKSRTVSWSILFPEHQRSNYIACSMLAMKNLIHVVWSHQDSIRQTCRRRPTIA